MSNPSAEQTSILYSTLTDFKDLPVWKIHTPKIAVTLCLSNLSHHFLFGQNIDKNFDL